MTVVYHSATGSAIFGIAARLLGAPDEAVGAAAMFGAIAGALPDILTWSRYMEINKDARERLGVTRWSFWWTYHEGPGLDLWRWTGVAYLHALTDRLVHPYDGSPKQLLRWIILEASLWMPTLAAHILIWTW